MYIGHNYSSNLVEDVDTKAKHQVTGHLCLDIHTIQQLPYPSFRHPAKLSTLLLYQWSDPLSTVEYTIKMDVLLQETEPFNQT